MPTITQLQYLLSVAETGHFGRAAEECNVSQPSLSAQIQKVEEELGEFRHALQHESAENQAAEFGDVLFSLMQVARWCDIDPVAALQCSDG